MLTVEIVVIILVVALILFVIYYNLLSPSLSLLFWGGGGKGTPRIFTQEPWISDIISGKKKVEARVGTADKYENLIGKKVKIVGGGKKAVATIVAVKQYKDLAAFLQGEGWENVAPHTKSEKAAKEAYLEIVNKAGEKIYDDKRIKEKGGIVALELKIDKK